MRIRFLTLITIAVLLAACESRSTEYEASPTATGWKLILIKFDPQTGEQSGLRLITNQGQKDFVESDGQPVDGAEPSQNVLWGNTNQVELIEGSRCVKIAGRKYCK